MILMWRDFILPAAYSLLPPAMNSPNASAMILAICLQESQFIARRQGGGGPARGFAQFETAGVRGVATHEKTRPLLRSAIGELRYSASLGQTAQLHAFIEHNDVLACIFARLLLWTLPDALPGRDDPGAGWVQYLEGWRPGKPHPEKWEHNYAIAWACVDHAVRTDV